MDMLETVADLIPRLINTLNPLSLSLAEAVDIHTYLMGTIINSIWLTSPHGLSELGIENGTEEQAIHETVFRKVLVPLETFIWHLFVNRFSIVDGQQSRYLVILLTQLIEISPSYRPTMDVVLDMQVVIPLPTGMGQNTGKPATDVEGNVSEAVDGKRVVGCGSVLEGKRKDCAKIDFQRVFFLCLTMLGKSARQVDPKFIRFCQHRMKASDEHSLPRKLDPVALQSLFSRQSTSQHGSHLRRFPPNMHSRLQLHRRSSHTPCVHCSVSGFGGIVGVDRKERRQLLLTDDHSFVPTNDSWEPHRDTVLQFQQPVKRSHSGNTLGFCSFNTKFIKCCPRVFHGIETLVFRWKGGSAAILRLSKDVVVYSSIEIRSEDLTLIGNSSRLLFQRDIQPSSGPSSWSPNEASTKAEPKPTPNDATDGISVASFMTSSTEGMTLGSTIILTDVTHLSKSDHVAPFVGLTRPQPSLISPRAVEKGDDVTGHAEHVTIVGTGLWLESKDLIGGTGPLFSFGVTERDFSLGASRCGLQMETSLVGSNLVNMTCSSSFPLGKQLFGSEVCQRVVGSCVRESTNHDSGTGMMSPNLGGNLVCLNTSFSSCIRNSNGQYDFSFENRTQSEIGRFALDSKSDAASVTFILCTFNKMTLTSDDELGGAAISIYVAYSSLAIKSCFFHKCICTDVYSAGGAVCFSNFRGNEQLSLSGSSFTECSSVYEAGSVYVGRVSSITINYCFFELSTADENAALYLVSDDITMSNTAIVRCSSYGFGGAVVIYEVKTLSFSFLQFRECSSSYVPDICFNTMQSSQITSGMIQFCDSTSGEDNVYFNEDGIYDSVLVPQIDTTVSFKSLDVSFGDDEATVTVTTRAAMNGTMKVLLDGSNVPRLVVDVVFGSDAESSTVGTAMVSSGANGILPDGDYAFRAGAIRGFDVLAPTMNRVVLSLLDWNTTEIVLRGNGLFEGSYWMLVENGRNELKITLTRSSLTTLTTSKPLHPADAEGRLEWSTRYKVTQVMWQPKDEQTEVQVKLTNTITFTTPAEPPRIEECTGIQLSKDFTKMIVSLKGRALLSRKGTLSLASESQKWESLSNVVALDSTHCTAEFAVGDKENSNQMKYGEEYKLGGSSSIWSGICVEDEITIKVPFPPKLTGMKFEFSNDLHTGCFVVLTGTDLIVPNSLIVTLNDSLSFIATVTSEMEAKSSEMQIGLPTTLQHDMQYQITSIAAMNEDLASPKLDSAISNTTGSAVKHFVVYVDSGSSSDSSFFCGDSDRPCCSIEVGWKIVEDIGISSWSISILHNTTLKEQVKIQSQHEVVIESGPSTKPELFVSPSSASSELELEGEGMVDISGGRLWIHQVDVVLSDAPSLIFIRMVGGHLTIETCSLKSTSSTLSNSADELCSWNGGAIVLEQATTTITASTFSDLSFGALNMVGGKLTIDSTTFRENSNNPQLSSFPSARRNIRCSGEGQLKIGSLNGGDGSSETHPHLWLSNEDCVLSGEDVNVNAPFFVPTLSSSSTSKLNKTEKAFRLSIVGSTLIPCSLFLEVFEKQKDRKEGQLIQLPLTQDTTSLFNESTITLSLPLSSLNGFDDVLEWRGRLAFGKGEMSATSFVIQENAVERRSRAMKENMKWWLPLLVSLVCLLLLTLIVLFVCWRRRKQTKPNPPLDSPQELAPIDEKMEIEFEDRVTLDVSTAAERTKVENSESKGLCVVNADVVECLRCGDGFATCFVSKKTTLFEHLHRQKKTLHNRRHCEIQLARGLDQVARMAAFSEMLRHVTSHRILIGKDGSLNVNLEKPEENGVVGGVVEKQEGRSEGDGRAGGSNGMGGQNGMNEDVRWQAPEEGKALVPVDVQQVGVFRLGLVLFEIETGSVPFGETDAVNAHRQLEAGMSLAMEKVVNKSMADVIASCLQVDPKLRPSFETVAMSLEGIEPDADDNAITVVS
ncbi:hypothetical protein BLNAU_19856 [Blattamonas nauphoetae]|uniref:Protein kinase domain-containing protein n=1 Tax=Blattamonas nauphoetae TaxID=2049346 RepID=A0ABQ9X0A7_9EUKA|nr:hypothetical protein BLNAU_19856 [Blattamonas nauphoetae]